jgi:signal transduction histidine kinase
MLWIGLVAGLILAACILVPWSVHRSRRQSARARAAERRAAAAERMAEVGSMTAGLAHEIKNPLSTIGLNAQLLAEGVRELPASPDDAPARDRLLRRVDTLRREAERLRDVLEDFLQFAGAIRLELKPTDLNEVVSELADFYQPQADHHGIRLRTDLAPKTMRAMIDATHLKQAILNLMINATQAMERHRPADPGADPPPRELILRTTPGTNPDADPRWELHVIDTGPGIAPESLPRIFQPYYTTKAGGSGLGLPTSRRLVEEHAGRLEVHSDPGRGSDFVISLPRA